MPYFLLPYLSKVFFKRLSTMKNTYDGYAIAEADLAQRGPGDFFAAGDSTTVRQSGGFSFRLTGLCSDGALLELASRFCADLIATDPTLEAKEHTALRAFVADTFAINEKTFS